MTDAVLNGVLDDAPHILIVDDDTRIRTLLTEYLCQNGFRVTSAATAEEARRKIAGLEFDLLILDVMMPGESGLDFAEGLRLAHQVVCIQGLARCGVRCGDLGHR